MEAIQIQNLSRDYGQGRGVFDLSFTIAEGEVFGFLGPNGAGKTTTIRHLMGFLRPRQGSCAILGQDCWTERAEIQKRLGYIPGEIAFFEDMTGQGFLRFMAQYRGLKSSSRQRMLMERFELDPRGKLKKMSKGMKQKVGIVVAFMHDPEILILDEPTSGLDPLMQSRFIDLIREERARGKTILMSSHMFEEVERTCHRVAILRAGRLAAIDSVEALKAAQVKKYVVTLESEAAARAFAGEGLIVESVAENRVTVSVRGDLPVLLVAMHRHPVINLDAPGLSLEEVFMKYYGGDGTC